MVVLLLYGGVSSEHEISCLSAEFIESSLKTAGHQVLPVYIDRKGSWHLQQQVNRLAADFKSNPSFLNAERQLVAKDSTQNVDFVFPMIHGTNGEDGTIQGFCEINGLPYAGCGVFASAACMNKKFMRQLFSASGIGQVKYRVIEKHQYDANADQLLNELSDELSFPLFSKPCSLGSSVGVYKAKDAAGLKDAIEKSFKYDLQVMVEEGRNIRELELSILGNYPHYQTSVLGEIIPHHEFYSYEAKYLDAEGASLKMPAEISAEIAAAASHLAKNAFAAVQGEGFSRIDFFLDKDNGELLLNEINTAPGCTSISMFPKLWQISGKEAPDLVNEIVELGLQRFKQSAQLDRQSGFAAPD